MLRGCKLKRRSAESQGLEVAKRKKALRPAALHFAAPSRVQNTWDVVESGNFAEGAFS